MAEPKNAAAGSLDAGGAAPVGGEAVGKGTGKGWIEHEVAVIEVDDTVRNPLSLFTSFPPPWGLCMVVGADGGWRSVVVV